MRFLLTIAAGICIGILIAPDKGSRTRKKITGAAKKWSDKVSEMTNKTAQNEDVITGEIESTIIVAQ